MDERTVPPMSFAGIVQNLPLDGSAIGRLERYCTGEPALAARRDCRGEREGRGGDGRDGEAADDHVRREAKPTVQNESGPT